MTDKYGKLRKGMVVRRVVAAVSACLLFPSSIYALGMGDIDVHSGLNQPLSATIRLISVDEGELDGLEVTLASQAAFERMGLDRMKILSSLEFEVVSDDGAPYVRVSSRTPVREPFLDFILSVNWANGQMLREYTLLLDPPVFDRGEVASPVEAAITSPATIAREAMDEFNQTANHEVAFSTSSPSPTSYGPTKTTDTLWAIAKNMRSDPSVSIPQMMLALLKENPEAFINGNVNNLKAGYVLRAPEMSTITALSKGQAAVETNRQYQAWLGSKGEPGRLAGQQRQLATDAAPSTASLKQSSEDESSAGPVVDTKARLQLVSPEDSESLGSVGGSSDGAIATLQQQLSVALEAAEVRLQENAELRSRLNELERQLANVQRLISLQDDSMSALQSGLSEKREEPAEGDLTAPSTALERDEFADSTEAGESLITSAVEDSVVENAEKELVVPPGRSVPPAVPSSSQVSFVDGLLENPSMLAMAGGGGVLALLLVGLMVRRRRQSAEEEFFDSPVSAATTATAASGVAASAAVAGGQAPVSLTSDDHSKSDNGLGEAVVGDLDEYGGFGDELGTIHAEESEIDPIAEADVYLAYRRYEQAESLLNEAIQQDDERPELKLKLMEIYHATKNQEAFEAQAEAFYAASGGAEEELWKQAVEMGKELCPDHPLFADAAGVLDESDDGILDLGDENGVPRQDDNLDFESLSEPEPEPVAEGQGGGDEILTEEKEFDLDFGESQASSGGADAAASDFDFNLDESLLDDFDSRKMSGESVAQDVDGPGSTEDSQPLLAESELDFRLDLDSPDNLGVGVDANDTELGSRDSDLAPPDLAGLDSKSPVNEFEDLDLDLPDLSDDYRSAKVDSRLEGSDAVESALVERSDFDLDLIGSGAGESVSDDGREGMSGSSDGVSVSVAGDDVFDLDAFDDVSNLDNVINFEGPDVALDSGELSDESLLKVDYTLDGLDDSLSTNDNSGASLDLADVESIQSDTATESTNWEIEPAISSFGEMDEEYSLFESTDDVVGTKLDLAKAYIDMGDQDGARSILDEVVKEGSDTQREEAEQLMQQMG